MLAQSFVFKLLDLKKSSRSSLMFFMFCLLSSAGLMSVECRVAVMQRGELDEQVKRLFIASRSAMIQSPIGDGKPRFDGPPINTHMSPLGRFVVIQSPICDGKPQFDGPPINTSDNIATPDFSAGPLGNE